MEEAGECPVNALSGEAEDQGGQEYACYKTQDEQRP